MSNLRSRLRASSIRLGFGAAILVLATACGSSTPATSAVGASSSPGAVTSPVATAVASAAPGSSAPSTTSSTGTTAPSVPVSLATHADPALEAMLPTSIGGTGLQVSSLTLKAVLDGGGNRPAIDSFLASIGKSEADGSVALAFDPSGVVPGGISAFKVAGADPAPLLAGLLAVQRAELGSGAVATPTQVGGKTVTLISVGNGVNDNAWIYGHGDVVFVIKAPDDAAAAAFLTVLP